MKRLLSVTAIIASLISLFSCDKLDNGWEAGNEDFNADYHFYFTLGTMPSLYAGLLSLSCEKPAYMYYGRNQTFDGSRIPGHVTLSPFNLDKDNTVADDATTTQACVWLKDRIKEINDADPDATFAIYTDDLRSRIAYYWFATLGIDLKRVKVTLLSDGTGSYNEFYNEFGKAGDGKRAWNRYATEINRLNWTGGNVKDPYEGDIPEEWDGNLHWCYYLSTNPNYRYLLHDASLFETEDSYVLEEMKKMNLWSRTPYQMLNDLPADKRDRFFDMASFDSREFDALFDASPKPNLIILGTNPGSDEAAIAEQKSYTEKVCDRYGSAYDIFFKPHPADRSSDGYEALYAEYGLKMLPKAPFEVFLWKLGDKMDIIGGYQTTGLLTAPKEKVKFLFHSGPSDLPKPLNLLFDNEDVEWMGK